MLTRRIANSISEIGFSKLPGEVIEKVKELLLDFLGVTIAGSASDSPQKAIVNKEILEMGGSQESRIIGTHFKVPCVNAALVNTLSCSILELSDGDNATLTHAGQVVMPAALSIAEKMGRGGKNVIEAIVSGYEVMSEIGVIIMPLAMNERGFAPSGVLGSFGAAAAGSKILQLTEDKICDAMGLAATVTGFREPWVVTGTMDKDIMICEATRRGLWASILAGKGISGSHTILEGREGFLRAMLGKVDQEMISKDWGDHYSILDTYLKKYPSCRHTHSTIDASLDLARNPDIVLESIKKIQVRLDPLAAKIAISNLDSDVAVKFSQQFAVAVALAKKRAKIEDFTAQVAKEKIIKDLVSKVEIIKADEMMKDWPEKWASDVEIQLINGNRFRKYVAYPKGDKNNPMGRDEIIEKFRELSSFKLRQETIEEVVEMVFKLEAQRSIEALMNKVGL
jgi:2-methylcitrate dehydratase PrpD